MRQVWIQRELKIVKGRGWGGEATFYFTVMVFSVLNISKKSILCVVNSEIIFQNKTLIICVGTLDQSL